MALKPLSTIFDELNSIANPRLSFVPRFVVIIIAPLMPRKPYNAAAVEPFRMVKVSMSSGLIFQVSELIGTPSTTNKPMLRPRSTSWGACNISAEAPTVRPATLPTRPFTGFGSLAFSRSSPFTSCTE